MSAAPSLETLVIRSLRGSAEPLSAEQLLERVPAEVLREHKNPRQRLKYVLARPEVGHATRGQYVYFPHRVTGATLRLPLTGREIADGVVQLGPDVVYALWFRQLDGDRLPAGTNAACDLPDGTRSGFAVEQMVRNRRLRWGWAPFITAGAELREWLHSEGIVAGDSLRVRITDAESCACEVTLERLGERDRERVAGRNRALADAAAHVLRNEIRGKPLSPHDLAGWLMAADLYRDDCPPDPLEVVLLGDPPFTQDDEGRFALATKWEWTRFQEPDLPPSVLEGIIEDLIIRRKGDEVGAAAEQALSDAQQKRLYGLDPLGELKPWLEAVGYRTGSPDEEPDAEAEARFAAEAAGRREQVYRLDIQLRRRPSARKVLEVQGDTTLVDLDDTFRRAFGHDTMDHMGGFFVRAGGGRGRQTLATINPLGEVMDGEDMELAELDLEPEDEIAYVYDFGDWMEHTAMVKAVVPAEPGATYPREVELRARRGAKSPRGRRPETETEA